MRRITPFIEKTVCEYREMGMKIHVIGNRLNLSYATVRAILMNNQVEDNADNWKEHWLANNWGEWEIKKPKRNKPEYRNGYRIVHVGDKSNFRTPYRPDGVWR